MRDKLKERLAVKVVVGTQDRPLLAPLSTRSRLELSSMAQDVYLRVPAVLGLSFLHSALPGRPRNPYSDSCCR